MTDKTIPLANGSKSCIDLIFSSKVNITKDSAVEQ